MKRIRLLSLVLLVVLLTGCLSPRIDVTIDPDTIKVTSEMTAIEGVSLKFKMRGGISFSYTLKEVLVTLKDEDGGEERITPKTVDLENKKIPVFFGVSRAIAIDPISLDGIEGIGADLYDQLLKGEKWTLEIVVVGTKDSTATAKVIFE